MWWMRSSLGVFVSPTGQTTDRMCNKTEGLQAGSTRVLCGSVPTKNIKIIIIIIIITIIMREYDINLDLLDMS